MSIRTLDSSNFDATVRDSDFLVITFYKPGCLKYQRLAPKLEEADKLLPHVVFAILNAKEEQKYADRYGIGCYLAIKIFTNGGKKVQGYNGPQDAKAIVECLQRINSFPLEIKSANDANNLIGLQKTAIVGVFPEFLGREYDNFMNAAEKLKVDYDIFHTLDIKHLPDGSSLMSSPLVRIFKPGSMHKDRSVDTNNFNVDALLEFVKKAVTPTVTVFSHDPRLDAAFYSANMAYDKVVLFIDRKNHDAYETAYRKVAKDNNGNEMSFMLGYFSDSQDAFWEFELHESKVPLIVIRKPTGETYVNADLEGPGGITIWLEAYKAKKIQEHGIPSPDKIEQVKVVVPDTFEKTIMESNKHVFLWLGPWCHWCDSCKNVTKVLDDVAACLKKANDHDVLIAKLYKNSRKIRRKYLYDFREDGPILCFKRGGMNKLHFYLGEAVREKIIDFIKNNTPPNRKQKYVKGCGGDIMRLPRDSVKPKRSSRADEVSQSWDRMLSDTESNLLLVMYKYQWMEKHLEFFADLDSLADCFKGTGVDIHRQNAKYITTFGGCPKALVEHMHHFTTLCENDEPTIFFKKSSGEIVPYDYEYMTKNNIKLFIERHIFGMSSSSDSESNGLVV